LWCFWVSITMHTCVETDIRTHTISMKVVVTHTGTNRLVYGPRVWRST
jgi:hypothetical protein